MSIGQDTKEPRIYRARRTDGICPRCALRPRQRSGSGRLKEYCRECRRDYKREQRLNERMLRGGMEP
jgi:hypothetical protein